MNAAEALHQAKAFFAARQPMQAVAWLDEAERLGAKPDECAGQRWTCYMLAGAYALAWAESDAIRARGAVDPHRVWDGRSLPGQSVMVRSVHGFGDAIQMLRYAPRIRAEATRLTVQVAPQLADLVRCVPSIDEVVEWSEERPYDAQLEITELPYAYRSTLATLPAAPYLRLPSNLVANARKVLGNKSRLRIGLVWTSSAWDSSRSISLDLLQPLLDAREDVEFWSLQPATPEWAEACQQRGWSVRRAGDYSAPLFAACIAEMDLVITIDSFAAHLAGALGRPAWVLLKQQADWRWMIDRDDSPWYPTLRLFRQNVEGEWLAPILEVARTMQAWGTKLPLSDAMFSATHSLLERA